MRKNAQSCNLKHSQYHLQSSTDCNLLVYEFFVVSNGEQFAGQTSSCAPMYFCAIIFIIFITSPYIYSLHAFPLRETNGIVLLHTMKAELH